jgi:toxin FitB
MILLDTNVISALMRPAVPAPVAAYLQAQEPDALFTTSLSEAEIRYGIARLPSGRRRDALADAFQAFLTEGFVGRVIVFDSACAAGYAAIRVRREMAGLPVSIPEL